MGFKVGGLLEAPAQWQPGVRAPQANPPSTRSNVTSGVTAKGGLPGPALCRGLPSAAGWRRPRALFTGLKRAEGVGARHRLGPQCGGGSRPQCRMPSLSPERAGAPRQLLGGGAL